MLRLIMTTPGEKSQRITPGLEAVTVTVTVVVVLMETFLGVCCAGAVGIVPGGLPL